MTDQSQPVHGHAVHGDAVQDPEPVAEAVNTEAVNTEAVGGAEEVAGAGPRPATPRGRAPDHDAAGAPTEDAGDAATGAAAQGAAPATGSGQAAGEGPESDPATTLAAERLADLQRLQAEYVNYKRRVDRDRALMQELAVHGVLESLLPVLDDIEAARRHGDLVDGPFVAIADKLEATLAKHGLVRYGAPGEVFDPIWHDALMHLPWDAQHADVVVDAASTTIVQVIQPGYRAGDKVLRPARVAVADPE